MAFLTFSHDNSVYLTPNNIQDNYFTPKEGSIYSVLNSSFSIYKYLIDKSGLYRDILNNLTVSIFVCPDQNISPELRNYLIQMSKDEIITFLNRHTIDDSIDFENGQFIRTRQWGFQLSRYENEIRFSIGSKVDLINKRLYVSNGVIYFINHPILV